MRDYYQLIKPGIVYGNALTALAAFIFGTTGPINFPVLAATIFGLSFSIAAGCVVNNIFDRKIDTQMERTKNRALATGRISVRNAGRFALVLGVAGTYLLYEYTNIYALLATAFGVVVYLCLYTPAKRYTQHSTIIGALSGAVPPVVGYTAASGRFDTTAVLLFLILVCWQMTHFFAIAIYRKDEYQKAKLPIMSVQAGVFRTKILMLLYAFLFTYAIVLLGYWRELKLIYILPMGIACAGWIVLGGIGFWTSDTRLWARRMFFYSIAVILIFSITLPFA